MASLSGLGLKGSGLVAVLFVAGFILQYTNVSPDIGRICLVLGAFFAFILLLLGVISVFKKVARR